MSKVRSNGGKAIRDEYGKGNGSRNGTVALSFFRAGFPLCQMMGLIDKESAAPAARMEYHTQAKEMFGEISSHIAT